MPSSSMLKKHQPANVSVRDDALLQSAEGASTSERFLFSDALYPPAPAAAKSSLLGKEDGQDAILMLLETPHRHCPCWPETAMPNPPHCDSKAGLICLAASGADSETPNMPPPCWPETASRIPHMSCWHIGVSMPTFPGFALSHVAVSITMCWA